MTFKPSFVEFCIKFSKSGAYFPPSKCLFLTSSLNWEGDDAALPYKFKTCTYITAHK